MKNYRKIFGIIALIVFLCWSGVTTVNIIFQFVRMRIGLKFLTVEYPMALILRLIVILLILAIFVAFLLIAFKKGWTVSAVLLALALVALPIAYDFLDFHNKPGCASVTDRVENAGVFDTDAEKLVADSPFQVLVNSEHQTTEYSYRFRYDYQLPSLDLKFIALYNEAAFVEVSDSLKTYFKDDPHYGRITESDNSVSEKKYFKEFDEYGAIGIITVIMNADTHTATMTIKFHSYS